MVVEVEGPLGDQEGTSEEGMVIDFSDIKFALKRLIHDKFDHGFLVYENDQELMKIFFPEGEPLNGWNIIKVGFVPTAENIAKFSYDVLAAYLNQPGIKVKKVSVWETPTSVASYPAYQEGQLA